MISERLVYLGLGSNQDNPSQQITTALKHISRLPRTTLKQTAPWYQTKAWGVTDQADFINTAIAITTQLSPLALLKQIKHIEFRLMNRQMNRRWHSRRIDIDILYYGKHPYHRPQLQAPHPFMNERCFVLRPLLDLKPQWLPPTVKRVITTKKNHCQQLSQYKNTLESNKIQQISRQQH